MLKQIEGSHAMAEAIALCRPEVICAYPITPQTHIVEGLGELVKDEPGLDRPPHLIADLSVQVFLGHLAAGQACCARTRRCRMPSGGPMRY